MSTRAKRLRRAATQAQIAASIHAPHHTRPVEPAKPSLPEADLPSITLTLTANWELRVRLPGNPGNSQVLPGVGIGNTLRDAQAMAILIKQLQEAMKAHRTGNDHAQRQVGTLSSLTVTQVEEFFRTNPERIYQRIPTATAEEMGI